MSKVCTKTKKKKAGRPKRGKGRVVRDHLKKLNLNAAGIDLGSKEHYVAVPVDRDPEPVRSFGCFTTELHRMADWLESCGIETVAMESTGVYWIPVYQVLEDRGFKVMLVDARKIKHVPGRKSDVQDCQWIQELHTYGLLSGSFVPDKEIGTIRTLWRHRGNLVTSCATQIHLMQKALDIMNLHLHKVLSDITGVTGMSIIRAIVSGERNPVKLARLKNPKVKASEDEIVQALTGYYRRENLFSLQQALEGYDFLQKQITACDRELESFLSTMESKASAEDLLEGRKKRKKSHSKNEPAFNLHQELHRLCGVDLTRIDGLNVLTVQTIISEIGLDMSKFPTEKHLVSYLGLCPNNFKTGGKVKKTKSKKVKNRATWAFHMAAQSLHKSDSALGAYYRRMKYRLDTPKANTATANKLCRIFYRMLKFGEEFVDIGIEAYEKQYQERKLAGLIKRAKSMGFNLLHQETGEVVS